MVKPNLNEGLLLDNELFLGNKSLTFTQDLVTGDSRIVSVLLILMIHLLSSLTIELTNQLLTTQMIQELILLKMIPTDSFM